MRQTKYTRGAVIKRESRLPSMRRCQSGIKSGEFETLKEFKVEQQKVTMRRHHGSRHGPNASAPIARVRACN
jgi:hypothetical protein